MNHKKGYATTAEAACSKLYLNNPDAYIDEGCPCGQVHVEVVKAPRPSMNERRDTGPDAKTRKAVYDRDEWACVCCGQSIAGRPHSVGHRKRRSQGGTNDKTNLLTFLGYGINSMDPDDHHARIDSRRNRRDEDNGYTVRSFGDPALTPVTVVGADGLEERVFLTSDGKYDTEPPAVAA